MVLLAKFNITWGQNVGIGTNTPQKLLSIGGSLLIDQNNENAGTLDSAGLRFGTASGVGISSSRIEGATNRNGLDFWTNNSRRMIIAPNGYVGINMANPSYFLHVGGTVAAQSLRSSLSIVTEGSLEVSSSSFLYGNASIPNGYVGIGANATTANRLRVNGNLLVNTNIGVDGNARIDGTVNIGGKITNEGRAIMKSNSSTTLRSGFSSGTFSISLNAGGRTSITFCTIPYTGNNTNVRVMVAQFIPGTGASANAGDVNINVVGTTTNFADGCGGYAAIVRFSNNTSSLMNLGTNANLYLYTVVTD